MRIPNELEEKIEKEIKNISLTELRDTARILSDRYMNAKRTGQSLLNKNLEVLAYSIIRMPATFGAINKALEETLDIYNPTIKTVLDIGSGTGAGEWAVLSNINVEEIICIEREKEMENMAKKLLQGHNNINWKNQDIVHSNITDKADLVITSYMINELQEASKEKVIKDILETFNKLAIFIEPGTPEGFNNIRRVQRLALESNLNIIAPCTCQAECNLPADDWCHSIVRVERSKVHKFVKDADVPYEDEKFSYIAISREKIDNSGARILRHPNISSGFIKVKLCNNGNIEEKTITKKEKDLKKKDEKLEKDIDKTEKKDAETVEAQADNADADNTASDAEAAGDTDNDKSDNKKKDPRDAVIDELQDRVKRQMAEFDNYRKRTDKEKSAMFEMGASDVIKKLLPIVDNFERGFKAITDEEKETPFAKGMDMVYKQTMKMLEDLEVKPIEAVGLEFNPDVHNAVMHVEDDSVGEGIVVEEFEKGYTYRDTVIRHSMVKVAN